MFMEIFRQILSHALRQRGHQRAHAPRAYVANLTKNIIHLGLHGPDNTFGVYKSGGTHHLLDEGAPRALQFPRSRGRRYIDSIGPHVIPFLKLEGPVVNATGQAKAIFSQGRLALEVATKHAADLWYSHVALIHHEHGVLR